MKLLNIFLLCIFLASASKKPLKSGHFSYSYHPGKDFRTSTNYKSKYTNKLSRPTNPWFKKSLYQPTEMNQLSEPIREKTTDPREETIDVPEGDLNQSDTESDREKISIQPTSVIYQEENKIRPKINFNNLPENIHDIISEFENDKFANENDKFANEKVLKIKHEIMDAFHSAEYIKTEYSKDYKKGVVILKVDVKPTLCYTNNRYAFFLTKSRYEKLEDLGLKKITVSLDSVTKEEFKKSTFDNVNTANSVVLYDSDWKGDDLVISFHFISQKQYFWLLKNLHYKKY